MADGVRGGVESEKIGGVGNAANPGGHVGDGDGRDRRAGEQRLVTSGLAAMTLAETAASAAAERS